MPDAKVEDVNISGYTVLELFTSQGCSSCPSADALLQELDAEHENVIALSFHVDYWNYLGWEDPFSSPYFSARQTDYTDVLKARTYTPQLVINGREELIGSRSTEIRRAVKKEQERSLSLIPSIETSSSGKTFSVSYSLEEAPAGCRVTALLVQPEATSSIRRGENRGKELHHVNVVRVMEHAPAATSGCFTLLAPEDMDLASAEVVLLVQNEQTMEIVGAVR